MLDYRLLLWKYINHVGYWEGVTFCDQRRSVEDLTDEEWAELQALDAMASYVAET